MSRLFLAFQDISYRVVLKLCENNDCKIFILNYMYTLCVCDFILFETAFISYAIMIITTII